ncbi:ATP-dependent DNA ligase [Spongiactinospora gelatinilytica]|uniref:ATP-dependent DNA ligase n=1 Tax=Spongiactinospora gelatinilytica TaxID=2666298 RepID=A0A2W2G4Q5_9ACTN|nr:DNA polymerase ligase N-terminal domain-containing protein [Spongiactinospora gelatinilytica]PZG43013.1 ATP-dependent DNA ligase [Spongiactinospora gelatinilytica]
MADKLGRYRGRRDPRRTPEPVPELVPEGGGDDTFVVQEHHARALHWDLRLERDGVLVSWAVPKGLPADPRTNHLAVHTEDHPMEYASFEGEIPQGEYGGGTMTIWDHGTYITEKWTDREVKVVLSGERVHGRYVLFHTKGRNWMIHRMDPPAAGWEPPPSPLAAMRPVTRTRPPRDQGAYAYEFAWPGRRAFAYVSGGRLTLRSGADDITAGHRWLRSLGGELGSRAVVLDGEIVTLQGGELYVCYDLVYDDGRSLLAEPWSRRRGALEALAVNGPRWQTAPVWRSGPQDVRRAAREQGLPGVVAKRLDSPYEPGAESAAWVYVPS